MTHTDAMVLSLIAACADPEPAARAASMERLGVAALVAGPGSAHHSAVAALTALLGDSALASPTTSADRVTLGQLAQWILDGLIEPRQQAKFFERNGVSSLYVSNEWARSLFLAVEDVIGPQTCRAIQANFGAIPFAYALPPANPVRMVDFGYIAACAEGVKTMFGPRNGKRLLHRIGTRVFARLDGAAPAPAPAAAEGSAQRLRALLTALGQLQQAHTGCQIWIDAGQEGIFWQMAPCPYCWRVRAESPACPVMEGVLAQALATIAAGRPWAVRETSCRAMGDAACVFHLLLDGAVGEDSGYITRIA
jgi:predicted hydrocarbon binding protein